MFKDSKFVPLTAKQAGVAARLQVEFGKSPTEAVRMAREAVTTSAYDQPLLRDMDPN